MDSTWFNTTRYTTWFSENKISDIPFPDHFLFRTRWTRVCWVSWGTLRTNAPMATVSGACASEEVGRWAERYGRYPLVICCVAIENDHRNSGFCPLKMVIFHSFLYVYQRGWLMMNLRKTWKHLKNKMQGTVWSTCEFKMFILAT